MKPGEQGARGTWLRSIDRISTGAALIGGIVTGLMTLHVVADVASRFFLRHPLPGTLDITQFGWMPTILSLGLGFALLSGEHIRVNLITGPTGPRTQRVVEVISMILMIAMVALFIWFGVEQAIASTDYGERALSVTWFAIWPYRWVMCIGLIVFLLQACASLYRAATIEEFIPDDAEEAAAAVALGETVFDELARKSSSHVEQNEVEQN